jgi:pSer/pThr/pTyr-binding forkhead associated (FHA) protein
VSIGREATNTVSLSNDNTVSRRHASIEQSGGSYVIRDEGSSNGVYVNGVKISGMQPIHSGDEIQIGNTRFRFEA